MPCTARKSDCCMCFFGVAADLRPYSFESVNMKMKKDRMDSLDSLRFASEKDMTTGGIRRADDYV